MQVSAQIIESGILDRVRQLAMKIEFGNSSTVEEWRENVKSLSSIEDLGLARFSSKINAISRKAHKVLAIDDYLSYDLAWINPRLKRTTTCVS